MSKQITFIDLFAGIGGFHIALHNVGAKCVFASEIDRFSRETYTANFKSISPDLFNKNYFAGDIRNINPFEIPNFDILCAGFPCQPFSQAGYKKGFQDELQNRGNMFFEILKIINIKRPNVIFLENVRHLKKHDEGRTFNTIKKHIESQGYSFHYKVVKASDHGLPQHRPRLFIVGFLKEKFANISFDFPEPEPLVSSMSDIFNGQCMKKIGYTLRVGGRSSGIDDRRNWDTYLVDNKIIKLSVEHAKKMQGFPRNFIFPVSETQAMKQLGNSVAIPAIEATARKIVTYIQTIKNQQIGQINNYEQIF